MGLRFRLNSIMNFCNFPNRRKGISSSIFNNVDVNRFLTDDFCNFFVFLIKLDKKQFYSMFSFTLTVCLCSLLLQHINNNKKN